MINFMAKLNDCLTTTEQLTARSAAKLIYQLHHRTQLQQVSGREQISLPSPGTIVHSFGKRKNVLATQIEMVIYDKQ